MDSQIFRKQSMDRISSPERLQDYIRVTNPGIWTVLAAVIVLLAGMLALSAAGDLETTLAVDATASGGVVTAVLPRSGADEVKVGMPLRIGESEANIEYVYEDSADQTTVRASMDVPDGTYDAQIVTETIKPISFLINN